MPRLLACAILAPVVFAAGAAAQSDAPAQPSFELVPVDARAAAWREDLAFLAAELPTRHKNAWHETSAEAWNAEVARLDADIPTLADHEITVRLVQLVALIGDSHTRVETWRTFGAYPVRIKAFPEGMYIAYATPEHAASIGRRITAIDGTPIIDAAKSAATVASHENEVQTREGAANALSIPEVLHALHIADSPDTATFTLEDPAGGAPTNLTLTPLPREGQLAWAGRPSAKDLPLYRTDTGNPYWWRLIDNGKLLYIAYNQCTEAKDRPFIGMVEEVSRALDESKPAKVVVDFRNNGGGASIIAMPLIDRLRVKANEPGRLFVLIGSRTHSSAMMNAQQFRNATHAVLVGEPTGGRPNSYGEIKTLQLPNSKLTVGYATKYFQDVRDGDPPSVMPDVTVPITAADFFTGRDPVLEAVRAAKP